MKYELTFYLCSKVDHTGSRYTEVWHLIKHILYTGKKVYRNKILNVESKHYIIIGKNFEKNSCEQAAIKGGFLRIKVSILVKMLLV